MLTNVWRTLEKTQKASRFLPFTPGTPLGGIGGEGFKNVKRHLCYSGNTFLLLMKELHPPASSCRIVLAHGDLRPANITVEMVEDHSYIVTRLIEWEYSGFYPECCEAAKITNCLSPHEEDDWWLLDHVRETRVV
ncbi:hypothetical protein BDV19DRAFT_383632 [Aspergillus venezuelensis]